ncbi:MAG: FKBP-type peptidyl-prolyl cis-trans isomerase [Ferruginibacter sp.]
MKKVFICVIATVCIAGSVSAQKKSTAKPAVKKAAPMAATSIMKNLSDSFSYAAGMNIAGSMKDQGIININNALMQKAIQDVFNNNKLLLTKEQSNITLQKQLQIFAMKKSAEQKAKNDLFFAANKLHKGVIVLPSGLQYEILEAGDPAGAKPTLADTVVVDYVGSLSDGTEFESSRKNGQPATFQLGGVIKGWTEILQLMTKGAKWKVAIPSELAYGERGSGAIPPNSVLVFEITLRDIKPATKQ